MIRIKLPDGVEVECDTPAEAKEFVEATTYAPHERQAMQKALCSLGKHRGDKNDENHCVGCGTCIHAGMC